MKRIFQIIVIPPFTEEHNIIICIFVVKTQNINLICLARCPYPPRKSWRPCIVLQTMAVVCVQSPWSCPEGFVSLLQNPKHAWQPTGSHQCLHACDRPGDASGCKSGMCGSERAPLWDGLHFHCESPGHCQFCPLAPQHRLGRAWCFDGKMVNLSGY